MRKKNPLTRPVIEALERGIWILRILILLGFVAFVLSGIKSIQPNEAALILRFGRLAGVTRAERIHGAGLLPALPYPIDEVVRVPVQDIREVNIEEFKPQSQGYYSETLNPTQEGYCVTGDQYIVQLSATVKYQITDLVAYALVEMDPVERIRNSVQAEFLRAIGEMDVDDVLTKGKKLLASRVLERSQNRLNNPDAGITLIAVELNEIIPPPAVRQAFEDVVSSAIQKETMVREAEKYYAGEIPQAETLAYSMVREADSYRQDLLSRTKGEITVLNSYLEQYKKDPEVVRTRIFREAMEEIFGQVGAKYLIPRADAGQKPSTIRLILPGKEKE